LPASAPLSLGALLALPSTWRVLGDLLALGLFGGFFIIPLYALIQIRSAPEQRARIIAANNILNALFMVCGALAAVGLLGEGLSIAGLFAVAALSEGELVAIFPEGRITDTGEFLWRSRFFGQSAKLRRAG